MNIRLNKLSFRVVIWNYFHPRPLSQNLEGFVGGAGNWPCRILTRGFKYEGSSSLLFKVFEGTSQSKCNSRFAVSLYFRARIFRIDTLGSQAVLPMLAQWQQSKWQQQTILQKSILSTEHTNRCPFILSWLKIGLCCICLIGNIHNDETLIF